MRLMKEAFTVDPSLPPTTQVSGNAFYAYVALRYSLYGVASDEDDIGSLE